MFNAALKLPGLVKGQPIAQTVRECARAARQPSRKLIGYDPRRADCIEVSRELEACDIARET